MKAVRVLIVDDSLFMRVALRRLLSAHPEVVVVGEAHDGEQAIRQVQALRPDVCTLDLHMPGLSGADAVREIMRRCPTPVVLLSAHSREGAHLTLECLAAGAVDFLAKPAGEVSADLSSLAAPLLQKLLAAAHAGLSPRPETSQRSPVPSPPLPAARRLAVLALSTGGPALLSRLVPRLRPESMPLLVVQHLPAGYTAALAERLDGVGPLRVREAREGDLPAPGLVLIAPGDRHLLLSADGTVVLDDGPERHGVRPAADVTMASVAQHLRHRAVGLVMTGMGRDGVAGLAAIQAAGGATYAQDRDSCLVYGMPRAAVEAGVVDRVITPDEVPALLAAG